MSTNNFDILESIEKRIDEINWEEERQKREARFLDGQKRVGNKEYCQWIEEFLENLNEPYENESWYYGTLKHKKDFTQRDIENEADLSNFLNFLKIVADIQRVKEYLDDRDGFPEYEYVWKFNNKYFVWNTIVGQGSITRLYIIKKPDFSVVDLDLYFQREDSGHPMQKYKIEF